MLKSMTMIDDIYDLNEDRDAAGSEKNHISLKAISNEIVARKICIFHS